MRECQAKNPATCRFHGERSRFYQQMENQFHVTSVPSVRKELVFHVGSLHSALKKPDSYEGQGLSISEHPEDWQRIAQLSGDVWELNTPLNLLNFHELSPSEKQLIYRWGAQQGWVEKKEIYTVSWFDDEWDQEMSFSFSSYEEALDESPDGEVTVSQDWVATKTFPDSTVRLGDADVLGKLAVVWVERTLPEMQGVWWDDAHDVSRLSAPRGVICLGRVPEVIKLFKKREMWLQRSFLLNEEIFSGHV